jgi:antimicrobial peptide system SdpB family protein
MPRLSSLSRRALETAERFDPRGTALAVSRTALAVAHLVALSTTSDHALFTYTPPVPTGIDCSGIRSISLWCVAGPTPSGLTTSRIIALVILVAAATGYRPRWTCIPHWYVAYSLGVSMSVPNGGEDAARIATMLLIPICLGDSRVWQWSRPATSPLSPTWRGSSYAAMVVLRLQVFIIYAEAATSKMLEKDWRDGRAIYSALSNPDFGLPAGLWRHVSPVFGHFAVTAALTWGTIVTEALIAGLVLGPRFARRAALILATALHLGIIVFMGLFSFGVIMIATVLAASAGRGSAVEPPASTGSPPNKKHRWVEEPAQDRYSAAAEG